MTKPHPTADDTRRRATSGLRSNTLFSIQSPPFGDYSKADNHYAMKAPKDRRAALAGEIKSLTNKLKWAAEQLRHVDAFLTVFQPGFDPTKLGCKRPSHRVKLCAQGDLSRMVLDILRRAGKPVTAQDVTTALLAANGHPEVARPSLSRWARGALAYQGKRGMVTASGNGRATTWTLNP